MCHLIQLALQLYKGCIAQLDEAAYPAGIENTVANEINRKSTRSFQQDRSNTTICIGGAVQRLRVYISAVIKLELCREPFEQSVAAPGKKRYRSIRFFGDANIQLFCNQIDKLIAFIKQIRRWHDAIALRA